MLLAVLATAPAYGQEDDTPTFLWLSYRHQHKVGERTRVFTSLGYEEQMSREDIKVASNVIDIKFKTSVRIRDLVTGR